MTRNSDRNHVRAASLRHRAYRPGRSNALGDIGVTYGLARGNVTKGLPDALLKGRAAHVQRQMEPKGGFFDKSDNLGDFPFEGSVRAYQFGLRESILQIAHQ